LEEDLSRMALAEAVNLLAHVTVHLASMGANIAPHSIVPLPNALKSSKQQAVHGHDVIKCHLVYFACRLRKHKTIYGPTSNFR
jgi:hypothetical protein